MAFKASFLPQLSSSRSSGSILPMYNKFPPLSVRKKASDYDLSNLSPRQEAAFLSRGPVPGGREGSPRGRIELTQDALGDDEPSAVASDPNMKTHPRVLFAGPPAPIATSSLLMRDEDLAADNVSFPRAALGTVGSVLFDRPSPSITDGSVQPYESDTVWRSLQRRERALQAELQYLLDVQSTRLTAHLDPSMATSSAASEASGRTSRKLATPSPELRSSSQHVLFDVTRRSTSTGEIVPVRQPKRRRMGLSAARSALARAMSLLADLKADEDASLSSAVSTRKAALAQLRRLAGQRDEILEELKALDSDADEPLARELGELEQERTRATREIAELEVRLTRLKNRKAWLDRRVEDTRNCLEAGLSGYRNALKEVDGKVITLLRRPNIKPLDTNAIEKLEKSGSSQAHGVMDTTEPSVGVQFLRLRPERRTIDMARDWWQSEVAVLEKRKAEVDKERRALEAGFELWSEVITFVTEFEIDLKQEMVEKAALDHRDKQNEATPEELMHGQLQKMDIVMVELQQRLQLAEERGWNLLICAIGAELEAFQQAVQILRDTLGMASPERKDKHISLLDKPISGRASPSRSGWLGEDKEVLVDVGEEAPSKNNDLARDRPCGIADLQSDTRKGRVPGAEKEDGSENEVPPEFLAEHQSQDDIE